MRLFRRPRDRRAGFTLTELAIVLVVVALLLGGLIVPLSAQQEMEKRRLTGQQLSNIREALVGFAIIHGRLPCPDTDVDPAAAGYGEEESGCVAGSGGLLPWRTLGVAEHDAWGSPWQKAGEPRLGHWQYRIERGYANAATLKSLILKTGEECTDADTPFPLDCLDVRNGAGQLLNTKKEHPIAIVYSTGANLRADGDNASPDGRFQADVPSTDFDDQLIWLARTALINQLIGTGKLP